MSFSGVCSFESNQGAAVSSGQAFASRSDRPTTKATSDIWNVERCAASDRR